MVVATVIDLFMTAAPCAQRRRSNRARPSYSPARRRSAAKVTACRALGGSPRPVGRQDLPAPDRAPPLLDLDERGHPAPGGVGVLDRADFFIAQGKLEAGAFEGVGHR